MKYLTLLFLAAFIACDTERGPDERDIFVGKYEVVDQCSFDTTIYDMWVSYPNNRDNNIFLEGIYNIGYSVEALATGTKLVVPIQEIELSTTPHVFYEFTGQGSLAGNLMKIDYRVVTVQDGFVINADTCLALCTKVE